MKAVWRPLDAELAAALEAFCAPSFFASPGFLRLWEAQRGHPGAWTVEAAHTIVALLPGVEFGSGALARLVSVPDGCYGGVWWHPAADGADRRAAMDALFPAVERRAYAKVRIFDFHSSLLPVPRYELGVCETFLVDIPDPEWEPPDAKLRSQIRKASREGIRVEPFTWSRHHRGFLDLVESTYRRHRTTPRYPPRFYRVLAELSERDPRVVWLWCEHDGRPACSHIYFVEGDMLQAWETYFDKAFSFLKPNPFLRFQVAHTMAERGVRRLNLGLTPPGAAGVASYKRRWGGRPFLYLRHEHRGVLGRLADVVPYEVRSRFRTAARAGRLSRSA